MTKKSVLDTLITEAKANGWKLYSYTDGIVSKASKNSNVGKTVERLYNDHPEASEHKILIGSRRRYRSEGTRNSVIYRV